MAAPQIGVLLPLRLETRFNRSGRPARWSIRVRVVPDAMSIANHDDVPSAFELDAVEAMWRAAGGANLESPEGQRAWRTLAASVGPERARLARPHVPAGRRLRRHDHDHPARADAHRHARAPRARPAADPRDLDRARREPPRPRPPG